MKNSTTIWLIVIVVIVILIGGYFWWQSYTASESTYGYSETPTTTTSIPPAVPAGTLALDTSSSGTLGTYLIAMNGMTLYKYTPDKPGVSNCTGQCSVIWPPYTVSSTYASPLYGSSNVPGQIGTITRTDGTLQVTYNNTPLYFYTKDQLPGDVNGQGVGNVWFVVNP